MVQRKHRGKQTKRITEPHKDVKKTEPVKKEHVKEVIKREEKLSEVQENTKKNQRDI